MHHDRDDVFATDLSTGRATVQPREEVLCMRLRQLARRHPYPPRQTVAMLPCQSGLVRIAYTSVLGDTASAPF